MNPEKIVENQFGIGEKVRTLHRERTSQRLKCHGIYTTATA
jgi:hypothetical protein